MRKVIGIVGEGPIVQMDGDVGRKEKEVHCHCDSTDAWTVAAYEEDIEDIEDIADPWDRIISIKKDYHGIRIPGHKKNIAIYRMFIPQIVQNWEHVTMRCQSAKKLETDIRQWVERS
ncbi:MAG TPA: hypothetical protein DCM49_00885 [Lachnospiraceae bacterium]|nr:hypothetical protein [Lachnospiraceae bacterium]